MIFDPSTSTHLKPWLVRTLEPICDAEPGALADYILALLKHNVPESEMRNELAVQLDEFLEKAECSTFIDTLFTVLRTKSYLPYSASSPSSSFANKTPDADTGIPIPLDGLMSPSSSSPSDRSLKRSIDNEEREERPSAKGPRLSTEGLFSRYSTNHNGRGEHRSTGGWGSRMEAPIGNGYEDDMEVYGADAGVTGTTRMGMPTMNNLQNLNGRRQQVYQPPDQKRGICRDYHNSGYCARGAMCKYSHADDAVVPGLYPINGPITMPFMSMFAGANPFGFTGVGTAYDPHEARMDMRPMGNRPPRAPLLPRIQQGDGTQGLRRSHASGELPVIQDLTPVLPENDNAQREIFAQGPLQPAINEHQTPPPPLPRPEPFDASNYLGQNERTNGQSLDPLTDQTRQIEVGLKPNYNSFRGPGVKRGIGGSFGGEIHKFRPERRNDKTLVVEKIPNDKLSLDQVNEWFKRFGTVTNVAIDGLTAKALISFSSHEEAYAAWKSQEAVFGNRFVKVFWHRPMEGHGQVGAKLLAASAPLIATISNKSLTSPSLTTTPVTNYVPQKSSANCSASTSSLAAKHQLLEKQIAEQKSLMASLATASSKEKKTILSQLRNLGEEMKQKPREAPLVPQQSDISGGSRDEKEKEWLDKELEIHNAVGGDDSTAALRVKLEQLKAEAASLGIAEPGAEPLYGASHRPYRGRGRSIRGYRGGMRGGHLPRASMKLDNRPRKLLVKGVPEEALQNLRDCFETAGQVESLERSESGDIIVSFKTRAGAEQGMSKANNVTSIGTVQMSWYTGGATATPVSRDVPPASIPPSASDVAMKEDDAPRLRSPGSDAPQSPHAPDEEPVASGWGEDGDGEDGMGML